MYYNNLENIWFHWAINQTNAMEMQFHKIGIFCINFKN